MTGETHRQQSPAQQTAQNSAQNNAQNTVRIEAQLDAALEDSFPASDPVSFTTSQMEDYWRVDPEPAPNRLPLAAFNKPPVAVGAPRRARQAQRTEIFR